MTKEELNEIMSEVIAEKSGKALAKMETFSECPDYLPSCAHYAQLLAMAAEKQRITTAEARKRYGLYTYRQWAAILEG